MNVKHPTRASDLAFLGIGDAGCYGQGQHPDKDPRWSRYSVSIPDNRLDCYFWRLVDGGTVLDKRPAFKRDDKAAVHEVIAGPMLDVWLDPGHVDTLMEGKRPLGPDERPRALDSVALDIHLARWRPLGGRAGTRQGDEIVWEDGEREAITIPAWELART